MTTYRTGNPIGSTDPRDLYDNAQNADEATNSLEKEYWDDRLGRKRLTWEGMTRLSNLGAAVEAAERAEAAADAAEQVASMGTYLTKADADAALPQPEGTYIRVTNDPDPANNGNWVSDGSQWIWSGVQPANSSDVQDLQRLTANTLRLGLPGWLLVHIDQLTQRLLMGLRDNGDMHVSGGMTVGGRVNADGVALAVPSVGNLLEAHVGAGGRAISYWTKSGQRYQILGDGQFGLVYDPAWFSGGNTPDSEPSLQKTALQLLIQRCYNALEDVNLVVIGDSISWGVGAENTGPTSPRDHRLSDVRANLTCRSWVNLLREYLGRRYLDVALDATPTPETAPGAESGGSGSYSAVQSVSLSAVAGARYQTSGGESFTPSIITAGTNALTADAVEIPPGCRVSVPVLGADFDIYFQKITDSVERRFSVLFDDDVLDSVVFSDPTQGGWGASATVSPAAYQTGVLSIRNDSATVLRLEGVQRTKTIRVINQGISGTTSQSWLPVPPSNRLLLIEGVPVSASDVIVALGTNDRLSGNSTRVEANIAQIVGWLHANRPGVTVTLLGAYATLEDTGKQFHQRDVARALVSVAAKKQVSALSPYQQMRDEIDDGAVLFTAPDLLHPNDAGHRSVFKIVQHSAEIFTSR